MGVCSMMCWQGVRHTGHLNLHGVGEALMIALHGSLSVGAGVWHKA